MEIEINGIKYEQIPKDNSYKNDRLVGRLLLIATMFGYSSQFGGSSKTLPTDDIVKEFELIQLKQSKLSRSERDRVIVAFKRLYRVKKTSVDTHPAPE